MFLSVNGPPPHFGPAKRSWPNDPPRAAPLPRPSPPRALVPFFPRAHVRVRPRQARRAAWRAHAGDAGRVASRGPRKHARRADITPPQLRIQAVRAQHSALSQPQQLLPRAVSSATERRSRSAGDLLLLPRLIPRFLPPAAPPRRALSVAPVCGCRRRGERPWWPFSSPLGRGQARRSSCPRR